MPHDRVALNDTEHRTEWCGVTAAVRERARRDLAYVNVSRRTYRWSEPRLRRLTPTLLATAAEIEGLHQATAG